MTRSWSPRSVTLTVQAALLTCVGLAIAVLAGSATSQTPGAQGVPMTAMIVGDSITQGSAGDFTWRYRLFKALTAAGVTVTFEGPYTDLFDNVAGIRDGNHTYADPSFDQHHDALWGNTLQAAAALIRKDVATYSPDYLLVALGLDDMAWGLSDAAGTESSLKTFIAGARAAKPDERFVFSQIPPNAREHSDPPFAAMIGDYNRRLVEQASALSTSQSPVFVTDAGVDIIPAIDLWDGTHPNARGEQKIAAGFVDALASDFGVGTSYPRGYQAVPMGPRTIPVLSVQPGVGRARLTWTTSPGATGYYVDIRDMTRPDSTFDRLPLPVAGSSWTAGGLAEGDTFQIYLATTKGVTGGVLSNTVRFTVKHASVPSPPR